MLPAQIPAPTNMQEHSVLHMATIPHIFSVFVQVVYISHGYSYHMHIAGTIILRPLVAMPIACQHERPSSSCSGSPLVSSNPSRGQKGNAQQMQPSLTLPKNPGHRRIRLGVRLRLTSTVTITAQAAPTPTEESNVVGKKTRPTVQRARSLYGIPRASRTRRYTTYACDCLTGYRRTKKGNRESGARDKHSMPGGEEHLVDSRGNICAPRDLFAVS